MEMRVWSWRASIQKANIPSTTKLVLFNLSVYMNELGQGCYPSVKQQAKDTGLSERAICTHLEEAAKQGFLKIKKHGLSGQAWARNEYEAAYPEGTEARSVRSKKGTERDDKKALNDVQSNTSKNTPEENLPPENKKPVGKTNEVRTKPKTKYYFAGHVIRLTRDDFDTWERKFHTVDLLEFLTEREDWYQTLDPGEDRQKLKNWFYATQNALQKQHREFLSSA